MAELRAGNVDAGQILPDEFEAFQREGRPHRFGTNDLGADDILRSASRGVKSSIGTLSTGFDFPLLVT